MIDVLREQGLEGVVDECGFARTRHTRHTNESAEGEGGSDIAQVVAFGSDEAELFAVAFATLGDGNEMIAIQIACSEGVALEHLRRCALKHHFSSASSSFGTDVYHVVGSEHHIFVVLHHDHGVAGVAQLSERLDETDVVALVKTDRRFIEDVEHIDQLRTNLCGEANALTFTTGEGHRCAREGEIVKTDIEQERETRANFFENFRGDGKLFSAQIHCHFVCPLFELGNVHGSEFCYGFVAKLIGECFAVESRTVTFGTFCGARELFCPSLRLGRHFCISHLLDVFHQTSKLGVKIVACSCDVFGDAQAFGGAIQNFIQHFF